MLRVGKSGHGSIARPHWHVTVVATCSSQVRHYSVLRHRKAHTTLFCARILTVAQTSKLLDHNWQPMSLSLLIDFHEKDVTYCSVIVLVLFFQVITLVPSSWPFCNSSTCR